MKGEGGGHVWGVGGGHVCVGVYVYMWWVCLY